MPMAKDLVDFLEDVPKIIKVIDYDSPDEGTEIWTAVDAKGRYPLSIDDSVFYTDRERVKKIIIDGKPNCKHPKNYVFKINDKLVIMDDNMNSVAGPFADWNKLLQSLVDNPKIKNNLEHFAYTYADLIEYDVVE